MGCMHAGRQNCATVDIDYLGHEVRADVRRWISDSTAITAEVGEIAEKMLGLEPGSGSGLDWRGPCGVVTTVRDGLWLYFCIFPEVLPKWRLELS